jgi:hypothetical protein
MKPFILAIDPATEVSSTANTKVNKTGVTVCGKQIS